VAILGMALFVSSLAVTAQTRKPNIIVFLADDLGYGELSCQGYTKEVPTPQSTASPGMGSALPRVT